MSGRRCGWGGVAGMATACALALLGVLVPLRHDPAPVPARVDTAVRTMTVNCERAGDVAFSTAHFTARQQILTSEGSSITRSDGPLGERAACAATGSTGDDTLEQGSRGDRAMHAANQLANKLANQLGCLVRLQLGPADTAFTGDALGAGQTAQDPWAHLVETTTAREPYRVAVNLADTDPVRRVDTVLGDYRAGGSRQKSYGYRLKDDLPEMKPTTPLYK